MRFIFNAMEAYNDFRFRSDERVWVCSILEWMSVALAVCLSVFAMISQ